MNSEENVEALSRAILSEVQVESDQVKTEAQSKAEAVMKRAQAEAATERKAILDQAKLEAERLRSQAAATAQLKARSIELAHREKLLDRVFVAVRQQLKGIQDRDDYDRIAVRLVCEAVEQLRAVKADLHADKTTQKVLAGLSQEEISKVIKAELSIGSPLENGTGVIIETADGHLQFDNTFDTRLNRMQNGLRSSVYHLLIGESA